MIHFLTFHAAPMGATIKTVRECLDTLHALARFTDSRLSKGARAQPVSFLLVTDAPQEVVTKAEREYAVT